MCAHTADAVLKNFNFRDRIEARVELGCTVVQINQFLSGFTLLIAIVS